MSFTITSATVTNETQYTSIIASETYYIKNYDGSYSFSPKNYNMICAYEESLTETLRGYAKFDISSIPDTATIDELYLYYDGSSNNTDCNLRLFSLTGILDAEDIYDEITATADHANVTGFPVVGNNQSCEINSAGRTVLQNALDEQYIGLGMLLDDETTDENYSVVSGNVSYACPKPTLYIGYTVAIANSLTLNDPISIDVGVSSNTAKTTYRDFSYRARARGKADDYIQITGIEITDAATTMATLREYRDQESIVRVAGLSDVSLNTDYIIKDLSYSRSQGEVCLYNYTLRLERVQ